jgi:type VI secretion system secreted protein VgrG
VIVIGCFTVLVGDGGGGGGGAAGSLLAKILSGKSNIKIEGPPEFQLQTMMALAKLAQTPTGLGLLQGLDAGPHTTTIVPTTGGNAAAAANTADANRRPDGTPGPGSDATVSFNPDRKVVPPGDEPWMTRDPAIGLGHELIHAHHYNTGTRETGSSDYTGADGKIYNTKNEEQRTAGVGPHRHSPMTENQLRKEFTEGGLGAHAERPYY